MLAPHLSVIALSLPFLGGCLPLGYGGSLAGAGGLSLGTSSSSAIAGYATAHFFPQGSRGVALSAEFGALSVPSAPSYEGTLGVGYASIPTPFDSPWGYELTARLGAGGGPGESKAFLHTGVQASALYRPWQVDTPWHQDRSPTAVLWYVAPFVTIDPVVAVDWSDPRVVAVAGLALYGLHYDIGAP